MAETNKLNRELLGKKKRKPFDKSDHLDRSEKSDSDTGSGLTVADFEEIAHQKSLNAQRQRRDKFVALVILLVVTSIAMYLLNGMKF